MRLDTKTGCCDIKSNYTFSILAIINKKDHKN